MMQLEHYFTESAGTIQFSRQQASDFAKGVAGDFNPIHDPDAKRFCVPGDLLFAVTLLTGGLQEKMQFTFSGMVTDGIALTLHQQPGRRQLKDANDKVYLEVTCGGASSNDRDMISDLVCEYVSFSGETFPHIMVPLMRDHQVMINPQRPIVIYESMEIDLQHLDLVAPRLEFKSSDLQFSGKRGEVRLSFNVVCDNKVVGNGKKKMLLSGLKAFEEDQMAELVKEYDQKKLSYQDGT